MSINFNQSRGVNPFAPQDLVECVDASGTELSRRGIYRVAAVRECLCMSGGGLRLTSGPRPTDNEPCGWWSAVRFRHIRPPSDELTERIRRARPIRHREKELT